MSRRINESIAEHASRALENGDWTEARDLVSSLVARGARSCALPGMQAVPQGSMFCGLRRAEARALCESIESVNGASVRDEAPTSSLELYDFVLPWLE